LDSILEVSEQQGVSGIVACNTTITREGLQSSRHNEAGGLSGSPLRTRSSQIVGYIWQHCGDRLPTIGVGGIMEADDARRMLDSGAKLVQIYTGLVYGGPGIAGRILRKLEDS
jgi:dihydroorotate dehydrogenase